MSAAVVGALVALVPAGPAAAQPELPGAPGGAATWTTGDKDGVGTAVSRESKVWYTTGRQLKVPTLTVTSPADLEIATGTTVRLAGTTSGRRLYVGVNGRNQTVQLSRARGGERSFDLTVSLPDIRNQLVVVAVGPGGGTNTLVRTVLAYGNRIGGLTDPAGDDNGPGTYRYPTNPVYQPGIFDLTGLGVYDRGANLAFVTCIQGAITNPFGGDQISHQRIQMYLGGGSGGTVAALPGTNMNTASGWTYATPTPLTSSSAPDNRRPR
jgi:hypothetical protein